MTRTASIIADSILACLRAQGLTVVRLADTTYGSEQQDEAFAADASKNAAMCLQGQDDLNEDSGVRVFTWSPAHGAHQ